MLVITFTSLLMVFCTGYLGDELSWALQTSLARVVGLLQGSMDGMLEGGALTLPRVTPTVGAAA